MRIAGRDQAIGNIVKWSARDDWAPYREQVFAEHLDSIADNFDLTGQELAETLGDAFDMLYGVILEDFFAARFGDDGDINVIDDYLKRRGWREKVPAKRYLTAIRDSVISLYEVVDLDPGRAMTVRDMIRGGDPVIVEEKMGSESAARWDRIAARLVTVNNKPCFTGGMLLLSHEASNKFLSVFEETTKAFRTKLRREADGRVTIGLRLFDVSPRGDEGLHDLGVALHPSDAYGRGMRVSSRCLLVHICRSDDEGLDDVHVALQRGDVERRSACNWLGSVDGGVRSQQRRHCVRATGICGQPERRVADVVSFVRTGTRSQQLVHGCSLAMLRGD